jgi:predicted type IV restriction endonuclease
MPIPPKVVDLIERFDEHRDAYRSPEYNEAQVRDEFIDPMFEALGWDIHNRLGFAEQFKQVVHEDSVRIGGVAKAPDYSFRLGGRRMFFLEAKKPSVNLKEDPSPAYQLRRYAWTAKLPVSILSDFEEFIVYDTRVKPVLGDKASTARVLYIPYAEYPERWEEMAAIFSPQAIQKGALDKYVESTTKRRGTAEVDDAFLAEIEEWRDLLARNIALRNPGISQRELNYAVQTTIDRIVFLRICEDRAIEPYAQLMALQNGGDVYARLRVLYERADERYNSGLFHFHKEKDRPGAPDTLTPGLDIDDKVLKAIIKRLYYPESPYEFSVLPAEILGQVYERFLGSVIRLTSGGQAKVEQKPEVRKAGGVYYTPSYIVDYIVKHTVGKLLEGKTPQEVAGVTESWRPSKTGRPLAILDPACGSGSFLLGAYQYLLDWHLEYYSKDTAKSSTGKEPRIYQDHRGVWRLATSERKRILLTNIYGVDIDAQAVEVTKLSLLLRVLEGESAETLSKQFALFHERALPDLANNIKCGNSLIGPDFYQGKQLDAFDEEETYRINAFDWNVEFPQIMQSGGFDGVIGNPPYVRPHNIPQQDKQYFWQHYLTFTHKADLYCCFIQRSLSLLRMGGLFSYIVSHGWLRLNSFQKLRRHVLEQSKIVALVELPFKVFADAEVTTGIFVLEKGKALEGQDINILVGDVRGSSATFTLSKTIPQKAFHGTFQNVFDLSMKPETEAVKDKMRAGPRIGEHFSISFGLKTGDDARFLHKTKGLYKEDRPLLRGDDIKRYALDYKREYVWYVPDKMREHRKTARPGEPERFEQPKVLVKDTSADFGCTFDEKNFYVKDVLIVVPKRASQSLFDLELLVGVLNSRLMFFYYRTTFRTLHVQNEELASLPLPSLESSNKLHKVRHDKMVSLVERMLDLHKRLQMARTEHERGVLERQIAATDEEIDHLVYELYELTDEETAIVEKSRIPKTTQEDQ